MTNSDELVGVPVREGGLGEGQASPMQVIPPKRSTTDPGLLSLLWPYVLLRSPRRRRQG